MENPEKLSWRIWEQEGMGRALLIGGLLSYVPVVNLILLGYWSLWVRRLVRREGAELPEWREAREMLRELVRLLPLLLVWLVIPGILALALAVALIGLLEFMHLELFAYTLGLAPLTVAALLIPPAVVVSVVRLERGGEMREAIWPGDVIGDVLRAGREGLFPMVRFYGWVLLGWPLIGFAVFAAALPMLAELVLIYGKRKTA